MSGNFNLDDYVDVATRIAEFNKKYPDGSLQSTMQFQMDPAGWLCVAWAYRNPEDVRPGVGHAFEGVPGKTPYTRDSEAQNAETAAWGRAIVALGFATNKIASRQEVQARQAPAGDPSAEPATPQTTDDAKQPGQVIVPFGKHKGKPVSEVPSAYWDWWLAQDGNKNPEVLAAVVLYMGIESPSSTPADDDLDIPF